MCRTRFDLSYVYLLEFRRESILGGYEWLIILLGITLIYFFVYSF